MSYEVSERGTGGAIFAATLMIIAGALGSLQGIALIAKGDYYVQPAGYWINTEALHPADVPLQVDCAAPRWTV